MRPPRALGWPTVTFPPSIICCSTWRNWSCGTTPAGSPLLGDILEEFQWSSRDDGVPDRTRSLELDNDSLQWTSANKADWTNTLQLPVPLGWMKVLDRCERLWIREVFFLLAFNFLKNFLLEGDTAWVKGRYGRTGKWVKLGCIMCNSQRINKEIMLKKTTKTRMRKDDCQVQRPISTIQQMIKLRKQANWDKALNLYFTETDVHRWQVSTGKDVQYS